MTEKKININFNYEEQTYSARLDFAEIEKRNIIKQAGWKWNPDKKYWQTVKREKVLAIFESIENKEIIQKIWDLIDGKIKPIPGLSFMQNILAQ